MKQTDFVKNRIKEENNEFYGEETVSGSSPEPDSDDDAKANAEAIIQNQIRGRKRKIY